MGVVGLNPDNPLITSGQEVLQMSTVIQVVSAGGGNTMHKDMDDFSYREQDIVKLGIIVMSLYWIVTTVKPPNKGHIGDEPVVPCREVVLFSEVFF